MDLMLPDVDGLEVVRQLRQQGVATPILALTARGGLDDRVAGLDSGCDDYLAKPFAFDELLARLRALLRRSSAQKTPIMEFGGISVDPVTRNVVRDGQNIHLTNNEYPL